MRVLATCQPAAGHLHPMVPLLRAMAAAGNEVRVATSASFRPWVERAGLVSVPAGIDWLESAYQVTFPEIVALRSDPVALRGFMMDLFTRRTAIPMAVDLARVISNWRPDLVVHDKVELGGPAAAEAAGIPHLPILYGATDWYDMVVPHLGGTDEALAEVGAAVRAGDPGWLLARGAVLVEPPEWSPMPAGVEVIAMRPEPFDTTDAATLPAGGRPVRHPFVHVTLGTVYNKRPGLFAPLIAGAAVHAADVLVTTGPGVDPADLGDTADHVRIEAYRPLSGLLADTDVVVAHAGWNTVVGCATAGVPLVAVVIGADHSYNAAAAVAAGWATAIDATALSGGAVAAAVDRSLTDPAVRAAARHQQAQVAALPAPAAVAERLARQHAPLADQRTPTIPPSEETCR